MSENLAALARRAPIKTVVLPCRTRDFGEGENEEKAIEGEKTDEQETLIQPC